MKQKRRRDWNPPKASAGSPASQEVISWTADRPAKIPHQWARTYEKLLELRQELLLEREQLRRDALDMIPRYSMHMADAAAKTFDRDLALSIASARQDALVEVEAAIHRLENNLYGICELTGKPIPPERLAAVPWTRFTVEAEAEIERRGLARGPRLGRLGSVRFEPNETMSSHPEDSESEEQDHENRVEKQAGDDPR